jgi:signal transduction histidine kinase/CheY-like chemotaxis protein
MRLIKSHLRTIRTRLIIYFLFIALIPMVITGWLFASFSEQVLKQNVEQQLQQTARDRIRVADHYLVERESDIESLAQAVGIYDAESLTELTEQLQMDLPRYFSLAEINERYLDLLLVSERDGVLLSATNVYQEFAPEQTEAVYEEVWNTAVPAFSPIFPSPIDDRWLVTLAVPLNAYDQQDWGARMAVVAILDAEELLTLLTGAPDLGLTGQLAVVVPSMGDDTGSDAYLLRHGSAPQFIENTAVESPALYTAVYGEPGTNQTDSFTGSDTTQIIAWYPLSGLKAGFIASQDTAEALSGISQLQTLAVIVVLAISLMVVLLAIWIARQISVPLETLTEAVTRMSSGDLDIRVAQTEQFDEIEVLEAGFNEMATQLAQQVHAQDQVIQARTDQLVTAADVSRSIIVLRDPNELLSMIVTTIQQRFQLYFVGIFLMSEDQTELKLVAASGHNSDVRLATENLLPLDEHSIIGQVSRTLEPYVATHTQHDPHHLDNPLLPDTQSELALPLHLDGHLLGVLDLQANQPHHFEVNDLHYLHIVADQVSVALENARLFNQSQQYARDMAQARETAEAANQAKTRFLANMSHELRTPLNAILGFTQVLERDANLTSRQEEYLRIIARSGYHLLDLINDVLEMSKLEVGRVAVHETAFNLHQFLENLYEMFQLRAESNGVELTVSKTTEVPIYISTDEGKLRQVIINLLGNALKFTKEGGISLRVGYEDGETAPRLHFVVEDTGSGIAYTDLDDVFKPFVQTAAGQEQAEGTGLGLAITRQYIHILGGEISIQSNVGQGTVVQFYLPIQVATAVDVGQGWQTQRVIGIRPMRPNGIAPQYRILVADDRAENRLLMREWLTAVGFDVREAVHGRDAVAIWQEWRPHLIWMDMRMPEMDGYEASRLIKSSVVGQETVIIALTASTAESERALVLSSGCDDFVRKPVREAIIFEKIAEHLDLQYQYARPDQAIHAVETLGNDATAVGDEKLVQQLTFLSDAERAALLNASSTLDLEAAYKIITTIQQSDPIFAQQLQEMVDNFRFDALQSILHKAIHNAGQQHLSS